MLRLGQKKKTACSVTLFSLKWYVRGRGGELEDPAWRVPLYLVPQGGSWVEAGLTVGRAPRDGWRAQGTQFGGDGGKPLELVMDTEAQRPAGHGVPKSQTRLSH